MQAPLPHNRRMKTRRSLLVATAALGLLAGCATVPRTVEIPHEKLQAALAKRFPINERVLQLLDLQVSTPTLQLLPESNRLRVDMALTGSDRLARRQMQGGLALSFSPRWEAADASIRMGDVRVERFDLQGLPEVLQSQLQRLGPVLAERALEGTALHTFRPDEMEKARGYVPSELRVTSTGLRVTLQPPVR
jgi:hypothetical protein